MRANESTPRVPINYAQGVLPKEESAPLSCPLPPANNGSLDALKDTYVPLHSSSLVSALFFRIFTSFDFSLRPIDSQSTLSRESIDLRICFFIRKIILTLNAKDTRIVSASKCDRSRKSSRIFDIFIRSRHPLRPSAEGVAVSQRYLS